MYSVREVMRLYRQKWSRCHLHHPTTPIDRLPYTHAELHFYIMFILFCKYLHSVIEEIPLACKTAVCLLVTHQPLLRSLNFFWLNKDITLRFSKRPQHKRSQPVSCIYIFMWLSCCCIWFESTFLTFLFWTAAMQLKCIQEVHTMYFLLHDQRLCMIHLLSSHSSAASDTLFNIWFKVNFGSLKRSTYFK